MGSLLELFVAPQGEGVLAGTPMLFVRLSGCRVGCRFCDTRESWPKAAKGRLRWGGEGVDEGAEPFSNPVPVPQAILWASAFRARHPGLAWASITGGEPLEQPTFSAALAKALGADGWKVYLETSGLHPAALKRVLPWVDFVSMDWKLDSSAGLSRPKTHRAFLKAMNGVPGQVKAVVSEGTTREEMALAAAAVGSRLPFVIQPLTPVGRQRPPGAGLLERLRLPVAARGGAVRILGQTHRFR